MPIQPTSIWAKTYKSTLEDLYKQYADKMPEETVTGEFWRNWIHDNTKTAQMLAPFFATPSTPTFNKPACNPLMFKNTDQSTKTAKTISDAWQSYWNAVLWSLPPPPHNPPFSIVQAITLNPGTVASSYGVLLSNLQKEFKIISDNTDLKAKTIGGYMTAASTPLMVIISGLSQSTPPIPLFIPFQIV